VAAQCLRWGLRSASSGPLQLVARAAGDPKCPVHDPLQARGANYLIPIDAALVAEDAAALSSSYLASLSGSWACPHRRR
jgi:hypothetical protein